MLVLSYQHGYKFRREGYDCSKFNADFDNGLSACNPITSYEQTGVRLVIVVLSMDGNKDAIQTWYCALNNF